LFKNMGENPVRKMSRKGTHKKDGGTKHRKKKVGRKKKSKKLEVPVSLAAPTRGGCKSSMGGGDRGAVF